MMRANVVCPVLIARPDDLRTAAASVFAKYTLAFHG